MGCSASGPIMDERFEVAGEPLKVAKYLKTARSWMDVIPSVVADPNANMTDVSESAWTIQGGRFTYEFTNAALSQQSSSGAVRVSYTVHVIGRTAGCLPVNFTINVSYDCENSVATEHGTTIQRKVYLHGVHKLSCLMALPIKQSTLAACRRENVSISKFAS